MYWPTVQMILWGLVSTFLLTNSSWLAQASGVLLAGVILWDVLFRGQLGLSLVFLEEMWSCNLGHLFSSPLRPWELIVALMMIGLLRTLIGMGGAVGFAILLYLFSIFEVTSKTSEAPFKEVRGFLISCAKSEENVSATFILL